MAYMNQEMKAKIAVEIKKVMPKGWKYSLGVDNHSTIVLNIASAPVDLLKLAKDKHFANTEVAELFAKIKKVMYGCGYYDNSDIQTDYFDTAYYVNVNIGKWNKPFVYVAPPEPIRAVPLGEFQKQAFGE